MGSKKKGFRTQVGRRPNVGQEEIIKLIEKYINHFTTNNFPPLRDNLWTQMSRDLDGRWIPRSVYTYIRTDKRGDLTAARRNQGILISPKSKPHLIDEVSESDVEGSCDSDVDNDYIADYLYNEQNLETFDLLISNEEWTLIKPDDTTDRLKKRLKKKTWAAVITKAFWKRYKFSCAFLGKWSSICADFNPQENEYFLKFVAYCKDSKDCQNIMIGTANEEPSNKGLRLTIQTRDTRGKYHREMKRPLNGAERKQVGLKLRKQNAANYQEELLRNDMEFGDDIPHFIQKNRIYRQVKMEMNKEKAGMKPKEKLDVIKCFQKMTTDPRYVNNIHNVGCIRFYVWYCTQEQLHVFKEYVRVLRNQSQISIDATGRVVRKFEICPGKMTGHVFLYTVTINFEGKTICVYQMVTEIHTQEFIENWLKFWVRLGAPTPGEAVSDYERAIPMSCCLTFNNMNLKDYVDACFLWATAEPKKTLRPAKTLIRIDVAHLMSLVSKWKCLIHKDHPYIKNFFIRCVALMVDSAGIEEFERLFLFTCIVALQPYEDTIVSTSKIQITVLDARKELENSMSVRKATIESLEASMTHYQEIKGDEIPSFDEGDSGTLTHQFIKKLIASAATCNSEASEVSVNAFYLPDFIRELERIGKEFPLWTAAAIAGDKKHASTAYQEGYFAHMRARIFQFTHLPCSAPRFVIEHLDNLKSGSNLFAAKLKHFNHQQKLLTPQTQHEETVQINIDVKGSSDPRPNRIQLTDDSDLLAYEKWKGLKNEQVFIVENGSSDDESITKNNLTTPNEQFPIHDTSSILSQILDYEALKNDFVDDNLNSMVNETVECQVMKDKPSNCGEDHLDIHVNNSEQHTKLNSEESKPSHSLSYVALGMHPGFTSTPMGDHSYAMLVSSDEKLSETTDNLNKKRDLQVYQKILKNSPRTAENSTPHAQSFVSEIVEKQMKENPVDQNRVDDDVHSVESYLASDECNQRAKEQQMAPLKKKTTRIVQAQRIIKPKGFYFQPLPEIKILNERKSSRRQGFLLVNGLISKTIKINYSQFSWNFDIKESAKTNVQYNNIKVLVKNTCGFDSLVHIIQFSALDNPTYDSFIQNSKNHTLQFVTNFLKQGPSEQICYERLKILNEFYPIVRNGNLTSLFPYEMDTEDFITHIWKNLFNNEPSQYKTYQCSNVHCIQKATAEVSFLPINEKIIRQNGYQALQEAVLYQAHVSGIKCRQPGCTGFIEAENQLNIHVCIELDVRRSDMQETIECRLKDFPISLELGMKYRLVGIIHHYSSHYIAYCKRASGSWLCCNDLKQKIDNAKETTLVKPHIAIYVRE